LDTDFWRGDSANAPPHLRYILPVVNLLNAFHLFKPGRLVAGDTSFFVQTQETDCTTLSLVRCSGMLIDFQFVRQFSTQYEFNCADVPFFLSFVAQFIRLGLHRRNTHRLSWQWAVMLERVPSTGTQSI
jgi:hypothetical protein